MLAFAWSLVVVTLLWTSTTVSSLSPHAVRTKAAHSVSKGERRAHERAANAREVCSGCRRPATLCVCDDMPETLISTATRILILQHPTERRKKNFSTVPLVRLVLKHVTVKVGYSFTIEDLALVQQELEEGRKPLLLYPGTNAISLDDGESSSLLSLDSSNMNGDTENNGRLLVVLDGTWNEAKRMARASPTILEACQQVQFTATCNPSIYNDIREEPEPHCVSTAEAVTRALLLLENKSDSVVLVEKYLQAVLQRHVDLHLVNAQLNKQRSGNAEIKNYKRNKRLREIEHELFLKDSSSVSKGTTLDQDVIDKVVGS